MTATTPDTAEDDAPTIIPEGRLRQRLAESLERHVPQVETAAEYLRATLSALVRGQDLEFPAASASWCGCDGPAPAPR